MTLKIKEQNSNDHEITLTGSEGGVNVEINGRVIARFYHSGDLTVWDEADAVLETGRWKKK